MLYRFDPAPPDARVVWNGCIDRRRQDRYQRPAPPISSSDDIDCLPPGYLPFDQQHVSGLSKRIWQLLQDSKRPMSRMEIAEALQALPEQARHSINNLVRRGFIKPIMKWRYDDRERQKWIAVR